MEHNLKNYSKYYPDKIEAKFKRCYESSAKSNESTALGLQALRDGFTAQYPKMRIQLAINLQPTWD